VASARARPPLRLLFDELLPPRVARALNELGYRTSHVGHAEHGQPPRASDDATILAHAMATNQIVVTYNHDMIMLCAERAQSVVWIDPRGKQFRHDELVVVAFTGIALWHRLLADSRTPICIRVMRTKTEAMSLERANALAARRMHALRLRGARRRAPRSQVPGQLESS
jgi:predicted nuclease of predicted toxin-antitoxin system